MSETKRLKRILANVQRERYQYQEKLRDGCYAAMGPAGGVYRLAERKIGELEGLERELEDAIGSTELRRQREG